MKKIPSPFQERLLAYILGYYADNHYSPTMDEMVDAMSAGRYKLSKGSLHYHTEQLVRMGRLKRTRRSRWRNLAPISAND